MKSQSVQEAVRQILQGTDLGTQEELREKLSSLGLEVTQSTISRALKKLGAIRTYNEQNQAVYALPEEALPSVSSTIIDLVEDVVANETMIVVGTKPGSASLIARHVDFHVKSIIGTVAGDDCLLVIPKSVKNIKDTIVEVRRSLGMSH